MKIKVVKKLKEMSSAGAVAGYSGPVGDKDELMEDGEIAANTYGSIPPRDDEKTFDGQKERARHQGNRAVAPQGKLLEDEEIEESMMATVGTAGFGYQFAQPDDEPNDITHPHVKRRRAQRTLNRALDPTMDITKERAKLDEASFSSDSYLDSVDRERFADKTKNLVQNTPTIPKITNPQEEADKTIKEKGYVIKKELGRGLNGVVYLAENKFKSLCAIKIVIGDAASREEENYRIINSARGNNRLIEMHFPLVFESWMVGNNAAVIVMETLEPLTDEQASFIPDASFLAAKNKPYRLAAAGDSYDGMRDASKRFTLYFQNKVDEVSRNFDFFLNQLARDWSGDLLGKLTPEMISDIKQSVSPEELNKLGVLADSSPHSIKKFINNRKKTFEKKLGSSSSAIHFIEILEKDAPQSLGANAAFIEIAFRLMIVGLNAGQTTRLIDSTIGDYARRQLNSARMYTQIPLKYSPLEMGRSDSVHERDFTTSKGLHAAIKALYNETGLMAVDLHDQNVMARKDGTLVIVDVGLFKKDSNWSAAKNLQEKRIFRKKMLRNLRK